MPKQVQTKQKTWYRWVITSRHRWLSLHEASVSSRPLNLSAHAAFSFASAVPPCARLTSTGMPPASRTASWLARFSRARTLATSNRTRISNKGYAIDRIYIPSPLSNFCIYKSSRTYTNKSYKHWVAQEIKQVQMYKNKTSFKQWSKRPQWEQMTNITRLGYQHDNTYPQTNVKYSNYEHDQNT